MSGSSERFTVTGETLAGIDALRSLGVADRTALAARCRGHRFSADHQIVEYADTSTDVHFIVSGRVRATTCSPDGKEVTYRDLGAGKTFGELSAIDGLPRSAHVVTLEDALVASLPADDYRKLLRAHPDVAERLLKDLAGLVRALSERVFEFSTLPVKRRVHAEVLRLAREDGRVEGNRATIERTPTHAVLASRIGTHREAVTRELNRMEAEGLIERGGGAIVVHDLAALIRLAGGA